jgi:putative ABC transport system permease protein
VGLGFARIGVRLFDLAVADTGKPYWIQFTFDPVVFAYLAAICVATGVIFGLAPALLVSDANVNGILKEGGRGTAGGRRAGAFRSTTVVIELTLTVVLLVGAGLMIRSLLKLHTLDLGIDTRGLLTLQLDLPGTTYPQPEQRRLFHDAALSRLQAIPGVQAAAVATSLPGGGADQRELEIEGRTRLQNGRAARISSVTISPGYFEVVGVGVNRGRGFTQTDGAPASEAAIVNERFVAQFMPNENPIGTRVRLREPARGPQPAGTPGSWLVIVGVTPTVRQGDPQSVDPPAVVYVPYRQQPVAFMKVLIRSHMEPGTLVPLVRRAVQGVDPDQPVYDVRTLDQFLAQSRWPFRIFGTMFTIFGIAALLLSAVGIYAVTAYSVTQRTQEIGVRMALGATRWQVITLNVRQVLVITGLGLIVGTGLAILLGRVMASALFGLVSLDPLTVVAMVVVLGLTALTAGYLPARKAAKLDPTTALRTP